MIKTSQVAAIIAAVTGVVSLLLFTVLEKEQIGEWEL